MKINIFPNDGCAIVYRISHISLLDMKLFFTLIKLTPLFQFEIAFSDIWIFLTPKEIWGLFRKKQF